jgi:hypothetical protein
MSNTKAASKAAAAVTGEISGDAAKQFSPELLAKAVEFLRAEAKLNEDEGWETVSGGNSGNMSEAAKRARPAEAKGVSGSGSGSVGGPSGGSSTDKGPTPFAVPFASRRSVDKAIPVAPATPAPWEFKLHMIPEPMPGQIVYPEGITSMRMWAATEIAFGKHRGKGYGELGVSPDEEQISYARWCRTHSTGPKAKAEFRDLGLFLRALLELLHDVDQSSVRFPESHHTRTFKRY